MIALRFLMFKTVLENVECSSKNVLKMRSSAVLKKVKLLNVTCLLHGYKKWSMKCDCTDFEKKKFNIKLNVLAIYNFINV